MAIAKANLEPTQVIVEDQSGELHERTHPRKQTVALQLTLNTTETDDDVHFRGEPLEVGRQLTFDFGRVTVDGTVTAFPNEN